MYNIKAEPLLNIMFYIGKKADWKGFLEWDGTMPGITNKQKKSAINKRVR